MEQENEFLMKPKIDFAFKELMLNDKARLGFISAVLGIDPADIKETRILNTELRREHADDKLGIIDVHILMVHVLMNNDAEIDTEINLTYMAAWANRALFYASKLVTDQLKKGDDYDKMKKCISISILDFKLFKQEKEYYSCFHLWEDTRHLLYTDRIEFHVIELPKLPELTPEWIESCKDKRMQWAAFLSAERKEDFEMIAKENAYIDEAYKQLQVISQDEEKRWMYRSREKTIRDQLQYTHEAERRVQEAEQRVQEAEQRVQEAEQRVQEVKQREQEAKQREQEAKQRVQEAKQREQEAKQRVQEAKQREQEAKQREQEAKQRVQEVKQREQEAKQRVQEAKQRERAAREEEREKGISNMINFAKDLSLSKENVTLRLIQDYKIAPAEAKEKVNQYWN